MAEVASAMSLIFCCSLSAASRPCVNVHRAIWFARMIEDMVAMTLERQRVRQTLVFNRIAPCTEGEYLLRVGHGFDG